MGSSDYLPRQDAALVAWLNQFVGQLPSVVTALGLQTGDTTAATGAATTIESAVQDQATKQAASKSATAAKKQAVKGGVATVRSLVKRIKSAPGYTMAIGQQLGIVGPTASESLMAGVLHPTLTAGTVRNGSVEIRFRKDRFSGVLIASRRGTEASFVTLGKQLYSPFMDSRPNLAAGPETRYYQAWYLDGDQIAGEASDILVITVPESGMEAPQSSAA